MTNKETALQRAAKLLSLRPYPKRELYRKLIEREFSPEEAEEAVERMEELGALDDEAYGAALMRRCIRKGYGPGRVEQALYRAGIERELRDQLLEDFPPEEQLILDYLHKHYSREDLHAQQLLRRASNALYRNGFRWGPIKEGLRRYQEEAE